jgi:hypothetical protein
VARSALRAAKEGSGGLVSLTGKPRTGPALAFHSRQGGVGLATLRRFLDRAVNLSKTPVEVGDVVGSHLDTSRQGRVLRLEPSHSRTALPDMSRHEPGEHASGIDDGEASNEPADGLRRPRCWRVALLASHPAVTSLTASMVTSASPETALPCRGLRTTRRHQGGDGGGVGGILRGRYTTSTDSVGRVSPHSPPLAARPLDRTVDRTKSLATVVQNLLQI